MASRLTIEAVGHYMLRPSELLLTYLFGASNCAAGLKILRRYGNSVLLIIFRRRGSREIHCSLHPRQFEIGQGFAPVIDFGNFHFNLNRPTILALSVFQSDKRVSGRWSLLIRDVDTVHIDT